MTFTAHAINFTNSIIYYRSYALGNVVFIVIARIRIYFDEEFNACRNKTCNINGNINSVASKHKSNRVHAYETTRYRQLELSSSHGVTRELTSGKY